MITPVGHRILVKKAQLEDRDEVFAAAARAGIKIAKDHEDAKRREAGVDRGWIVAIGPDAFKGYHLHSYGTLEGFKPWVKEGQYVAFAKYSGMVIKEDNDPTEYIVINDEDVVASLEG